MPHTILGIFDKFDSVSVRGYISQMLEVLLPYGGHRCLYKYFPNYILTPETKSSSNNSAPLRDNFDSLVQLKLSVLINEKIF
jgi:hypothetical protein